MSKLKKKSKGNSVKGKLQKENESKIQDQEKFQYFSEQLNFLKNIRDQRNRYLMTEFTRLREQKTQQNVREKQLSTRDKYKQRLQSKANISKIKKQIQNQVMFLNQQFLREYLYHEQPFNNKLLQINRYSDSKVLDEHMINKLKKSILQCIEQKKFREKMKKRPTFLKDKKNENMDGGEKKICSKNWLNQCIQRRVMKDNIRNSFEEEFKGEWENMKKEIADKVRFQGSFNWIRKPMKVVKRY